jgi:hypothetical protein
MLCLLVRKEACLYGDLRIQGALIEHLNEFTLLDAALRLHGHHIPQPQQLIMINLELLVVQQVIQHLQPEEYVLLEVLYSRNDGIRGRLIFEEQSCFLQVDLNIYDEELNNLVLFIGILDDLPLTSLIILELFVQNVVRKRDGLVYRLMVSDEIKAFRKECLKEGFGLGDVGDYVTSRLECLILDAGWNYVFLSILQQFPQLIEPIEPLRIHNACLWYLLLEGVLSE